MNGNGGTIRVSLVQPGIAAYRVPVYRELARRSGLRLKVFYSKSAFVPTATPDGFDAEIVPIHQVMVCGHLFRWQGAQVVQATRRICDVLILSWDAHYFSLIPALIRARLNGVGTIVWGHGCSKRDNRGARKVREAIGSLATVLLFYNCRARDAFKERHPKQCARLFVALNAIDHGPVKRARAHWMARPAELDAFRNQHKLSRNATILFCSRLDPSNNVCLLVRAAKKLSNQLPSLRVIIIGKGPEEDAIRFEVARLKMDCHIILVGAIYDEMALAPWFLLSDVFCYPENIGLSLLHAFSYGLPVVTSDRTDLHGPEIEAIRPGYNGVVYTHGDENDLAGTLRALLFDRKSRELMAARAIFTVRKEFTLKNMVDGFESAIHYCTARTIG